MIQYYENTVLRARAALCHSAVSCTRTAQVGDLSDRVVGTDWPGTRRDMSDFPFVPKKDHDPLTQERSICYYCCTNSEYSLSNILLETNATSARYKTEIYLASKLSNLRALHDICSWLSYLIECP